MGARYGVISGMGFPIVDLFDGNLRAVWLSRYFHQGELRCLHCGRSVKEARVFRTTKKSRLTVYQSPYQDICDSYSGTVFEGKRF